MKITYIEIAEMINRTKGNMDYMKKNNPEQLEVLKIGALCKKFNITIEELEKIVNSRTKE